jgi:hypothetical protein
MNNEPRAVPYDRASLITAITYHSLVTTPPPPYSICCLCGWGARPEHLGLSFAAHVADMYEEIVAVRAAQP